MGYVLLPYKVRIIVIDSDWFNTIFYFLSSFRIIYLRKFSNILGVIWSPIRMPNNLWLIIWLFHKFLFHKLIWCFTCCSTHSLRGWSDLREHSTSLHSRWRFLILYHLVIFQIMMPIPIAVSTASIHACSYWSISFNCRLFRCCKHLCLGILMLLPPDDGIGRGYRLSRYSRRI